MASQTGFFMIFLCYSLETVIFTVAYLSRTYFESPHGEGLLVTSAPLHELVVPVRPEICALIILFISHNKTSKSVCKEQRQAKSKTKFLLKEWERKNKTSE